MLASIDSSKIVPEGVFEHLQSCVTFGFSGTAGVIVLSVLIPATFKAVYRIQEIKIYIKMIEKLYIIFRRGNDL